MYSGGRVTCAVTFTLHGMLVAAVEIKGPGGDRVDADRGSDLVAVCEQAGGGDAGQVAHGFPSRRVVLGIGYQGGVT